MQTLLCAVRLHRSMDHGVTAFPASSMPDLPPDIVRQILAAAVHGMRLEHLNIVARNDDKNWPSLLLYLNLRGVCSGYVSCTCLQVISDNCMQWRCCGRMPAFC